MNIAVLIKAEDWEGLFINGELVQEGHTLNEGENRVKYFLDLSEKYDFDIKKLEEYNVSNNYEENYLNENGGFPKLLSEVEVLFGEDLYSLTGFLTIGGQYIFTENFIAIGKIKKLSKTAVSLTNHGIVYAYYQVDTDENNKFITQEIVDNILTGLTDGVPYCVKYAVYDKDNLCKKISGCK